MSHEKDGGPAFPQMRVWNAERAEYEDTQQYPGMTLRDWFAGQALLGAGAQHIVATPDTLAQHAYAVADAMLKARQS